MAAASLDLEMVGPGLLVETASDAIRFWNVYGMLLAIWLQLWFWCRRIFTIAVGVKLGIKCRMVRLKVRAFAQVVGCVTIIFDIVAVTVDTTDW